MAQRILRRREVTIVSGLPTSTLYEQIALGLFPKPVKLGQRAVGWLEDEVTTWQEARIAEREAAEALERKRAEEAEKRAHDTDERRPLRRRVKKRTAPNARAMEKRAHDTDESRPRRRHEKTDCSERRARRRAMT
jgi:prophage regulatory protein